MSTNGKEVGRIIRAIFVCFFLSGSAGLIYQVLWVRMLGLIFGHTVHAITTVLVIFMAGLALGSYFFGRRVDRMGGLLRLYGALEIGIGLYCLFIPLMLRGVEWSYLHISNTFHISQSGYTLLQFFLVFPVLVIPTLLMGGTLPILSRYFVSNLSSLGAKVGSLYSLNTLGAVFGTFLAGFSLLPILGIKLTLMFAAVLNIGIGALIIQFNGRLKTVLDGSPLPREEGPGKEGDKGGFLDWQPLQWMIVVGIALSGAASMIYEIAWTRALSLIIGSSTYAYSAMLLSFLVGIGAGSALFSKVVKGREVSPVWFAGLQLGIALSAVLVLPVIGLLPNVIFRAHSFFAPFGLFLMFQILLSITVMILPTLLIGATFPCAVQLVARQISRIGKDVGFVYSYNTIGAIVGSFIAGFFMIPLIGSEATIRVGVVVNFLVGFGVLFVFYSAFQMRLGVIVSSGLAVLIVFSFPHWDPRVMTSGIRIYAPSYAKTFSTLGNVLQDEEILFKKDGISSTVSIHKRAGITFLRVNGKTDASNGSDMGTQLLVGHLPSLLHPNPRSAFIVGLGSGVTPGAIARYPLERIDVVEIEPAMVEASSFFVAENRGVLSDPRVKLHHGDAKNVLLRSDEKYDLIINEPSNPWINGIATLFTEEFFALTRSRLNPEGVMVQWLQGYALSREDMRTVIATFLKVYPHASLWQASNVDYILVGGDGPRPLDLQRVRHVFHTNAGVREDLKRLGNEFPEVIAGDFFLNREELEKFSRGAVLNTDDLLPLGFSAPKSLYLNTVRSNRAALREVKESTHPLIKNEEPDFLQDPEYHFQLANKFFKKRIINEGVASLGQALMLDPDHDEARMLRGKTFFVNQRFAEAINDFKEVSGKNPGLPEPVFALGMAYSRVKDWERASRYMARAASLDPQNSEYRIELARVYARMGKDSQALKEYQLVMGGENGVSRIGGEVAATLVRLKQPGEALAVLKESIEVSSEDFRLHFQMGEVFLSMEKPVEAREAFNRVIEINPESVKAYVGLGRAWAALGDEVKANEFIKKAKHLDSAVQIPSDLTAINNQV